MKLEIKYSTFKKILIIVLLLNIILGISIYSEVKQISNQEQMKYILIFLAIIAIFFLGYLLGNYKGYMEGWNSIVKTDVGPKPDPRLASYVGQGSPKRRKNEKTKLISADFVKGYLDGCIMKWRKELGISRTMEDILVAECYIDAYQSVRISLLGELLQNEEE